MSSYLIDTYGMPSDSELHMSGCVGASRYVSHSSGKNVTVAQVKHIHGLGKLVQLNFEDTATNAKGGKNQGSQDAAFVLGELKALGAPKGVAVYFSVDFEVHTGQTLMSTVLDYFRPIQAALHAAGYKAGAYGDADVITALLAAKLIDFGWQTVAWSYGKRNPDAVLLQDVFTNAYDKDEILHPYIGAWTPTGAQQPPTSTPSTTEEFTMDADAKARFDKIDAEIADLKKTVFDLTRDDAGHQVRIITDVKEALAPLATELAAIAKKVGA